MVAQSLLLEQPEQAAPKPLLEVRALSAAYGSQRVLNEVSFQLQRGQILALIGPNGAGKTSLIRALSGVLPLAGGEVCVNGIDLQALSALQRARLMAVVPQARSLPPGFTAWETVLLGRTPHLNWLGQVSAKDEEAATQAMHRTHTLPLAARRVGELSGGEQQRLLLARALAQAAPVLLLDEPTTHLDLKFQITLLDQVRALARQDGLAVVLAIHDLNLVLRYADQAALLVAGGLRAFGAPLEVLAPATLSEAYGLPMQMVQGGPGGRPLVIPAIL